MVECDLAKVEVAGSNPVSRSNIYRRGPLHPAWRLTVTLTLGRSRNLGALGRIGGAPGTPPGA